MAVNKRGRTSAETKTVLEARALTSRDYTQSCTLQGPEPGRTL
jgi:hypothetical protein